MNNGGSGAFEEVMTLRLEPRLAHVVRLVRLKGSQLQLLLHFHFCSRFQIKNCRKAPAAVAESQI